MVVMGSSDSFTNSEFRIYEFFLGNICYDLFFNWQTENLFWTNKKLVFFQLLKLRKIRGNELVKTSYEFVIEIKFRQIDGCDGPSV